jgi:serine/threonine-protein kinase
MNSDARNESRGRRHLVEIRHSLERGTMSQGRPKYPPVEYPPGGGDPDATIPVHRPVHGPPPPPSQRSSQAPPSQAPPSRPSGPGLPIPESWDVRISGHNMPAVIPPSAPPPPSQRTPPSRTLRPAPRRGPSRTVLMLGVVAVFAVTAAAASIAWKLAGARAQATPGTGASAGAPSAQGAPAAASAPAGPAPAPATGASSTASAAAAKTPPPIPSDKGACFATLLPQETFGARPPRLDDACSGTRAYQSMLVIKAAIVRAGGQSVTPAMDEWSKLGWYETAAFAAMRAHCCAEAAALTTPPVFAKCKMDEALAYIANALDDAKAMREALDAYGRAATCIAGLGGADAFGRWGAPYGGEDAFFSRIHERIKKARGRL